MLIQIAFFCLLIVALLAGVFSYFPQLHRTIRPLKFAMDSIGYTGVETLNKKRSQQINVAVKSGLMDIHKRMDAVAVEQDRLLDALTDQQAVLQEANRDAQTVLLEAKKAGRKGDKDILQLEALASQMNDQQRLLVAHGQYLVSLNDQLTKSRERLAQQADIANMDAQSSLDSIRQNYASFESQASELFNKVDEYNRELRQGVGKMQEQISGISNPSYGSYAHDMAQERIQSLLDKEQEDMARVADCQQRNLDLAQEAREKLADSRERSEDLERRDRDLIDEEHQKQEDQQSMIRQRMADEQQRMQDQQNR
ncbi:MAG: hypothetical protein KGJ09_02860 [Candidatus Omnitrophica bacterium]|nr:hypothetical protein [Candidatus Omnitrophota bacterium]MDE2009001.1 hypothetical protein [Candidatus Omnitrophota bacterium]MDE2214525.1 hypothetical protein [Candidatus Omnitrophota bacterium]MDE2230843.1 hypothetical protein [Candidatus Omnitrophota bacterium]